jgi:hypothetical protein
MPTRVQIHTRERAERALRAGRAREALGLYWQLLGETKTEGGHYDAWLDGALGAYLALGRTREAGYCLLGLRRYAEAQRHFPADERPLEWALCAARLGHHGEAARVLSGGGHPALAALELEAEGGGAAVRIAWEQVVQDPRLANRPYETALAYFNLGEALLRVEDRAGATRAFAATERLIEAVADELETRGEPLRAFDCWSVLLRLGKQTGVFENVAEGYLNGIRILAAADQQFYVLQYYDDFLSTAIEHAEWQAAATIAREAADYSLKVGLPYDRHYLGRAAELWGRHARENHSAGGPVDLSANAFHAAIDAATSLGDFPLCGRFYAELAELPLAEKRRLRYQTLARRYQAAPAEIPAPAPTFPEYLRRASAYLDVWRQDLIEWELGGDPTAVLARFVVERPANSNTRLALRALLLGSHPTFSVDNAASAAELAVALGRVPSYEMLSPLEHLYQHPGAEARAAVMRGVSQICCQRSFDLVRLGLVDPAPGVVNEALRALRELHFIDGLGPLTRIFRESADERVRLAALESIARIAKDGSVAAALVLVEATRQETGGLRQTAASGLARLGGEEVAVLIRQARDAEVGERREALDQILKAI